MSGFEKEDKDLLDLCEANGIQKEDYSSARYSTEVLEMFLVAFPSLLSVTNFPNLVSLKIIHCGLKDCDGLQSLPNLERLWLHENNITRIEHFNGLTKLRELYLHGNSISKIEGLENCTRIEVLWLMENNIRELEGLETLTALRSLWLANNWISTLGNALAGHTALEDLNVAGNRIGSFREIPPLDLLPNLSSVYFSDPTFGENPVCQLCNYQVYTTYHLRKVRRLDGIPVTPEQHRAAESTFLKKKMYYNMRVKTMKRNTTNLIKKALAFKNTKVQEIVQTRNVLIRTKHLLHRELQFLSGEREPVFRVEESTVLPVGEELNVARRNVAEAVRAVDELLVSRNVEIASIEAGFRHMAGCVGAATRHSIARLLTELQTGGNIRLEEGTPNDVWYKSCVDLVKTRFHPEDFAVWGIKGLCVTKVTRVHSRFLKNRFEDRLEQHIDTAEVPAKKTLEYLFVGEDPELEDDMMRSIEDGYRTSSEYEALGKDGGVPLTNSVFIAEQAFLLRKERDGLIGFPTGSPRRRRDSPNGPLAGRLMIVKAYLGKTAPERDGEGKQLRLPTDPFVFRSEDTSPAKVKRRDYDSSINATFRVKGNDGKQRIWFAFDPNLVLPEYIVEFSYVSAAETIQASLSQGNAVLDESVLDDMYETLHKMMPTKNTTDTADLRILAQPFCVFVSHVHEIATANEAFDRTASVPTPTTRVRPSITELTSETFQSSARNGCHCDTVRHIDLISNGITSVGCLTGFVNLTSLSLAFNELTRVDGIKGLPNLKLLDLSNNQIKRIEGSAFEGLSSLVLLSLSDNLIYRLDDTQQLRKNIPQLNELNLSYNPVCESSKNYRAIIIRRLASLQILDGVHVPEAEREEAERIDTLTPEMMLRHSSFVASSAWSLSVQAPSKPSLVPSEISSDPFPFIVELALCSCGVRRIQHIERLRSLRKLLLNDNEIVRIEGLELCSKLEELNLEDNRIMKIEGLGTLCNLRRLELGKNRISRIENLSGLYSLTMLSLDDNDVTSLSGCSILPSLLELYCGNNRLESIKELLNLKELEKIIIADLSGNAMCRDKDYRLFAIYTLKKLKVFDGVNVEQVEVARARATFSGRMTQDILNEKIGANDFNTLTVLSLSNCGLKEIGLLDQVPNLLHLRLDHNNLQELSGLQACSRLVSLNLSDNPFATDPKTDPQKFAVGRYVTAGRTLETLELDGCGVSSITALQLILPQLQFLSLRSNEIAKLDGLEQVPELRTLQLEKNKIRAVADVPPRRLTTLRLDDNMLKSLDGIAGMEYLRVLTLQNNRVVDIEKLETLQLTEFTLTGNAVARKSLYRLSMVYKFKTLQVLDGNPVTPQERDKAEAFYNQDAQYPPNVFVSPIALIPANPVALNRVDLVMTLQPSTVMKQHQSATQDPGLLGSGVKSQGIGIARPQRIQLPISQHPSGQGTFSSPASITPAPRPYTRTVSADGRAPPTQGVPGVRRKVNAAQRTVQRPLPSPRNISTLPRVF